MYRLIEVVKTTEKETQGIYTFEDEREARAEYETKLGADMQRDGIVAGFVVILDDIGAIIISEKYGAEEVGARLVDFKTTNEETKDNVAKYDSVDLVISNFHKKLGAAMKDVENVRSIMLRGFDGNGNSIVYALEKNPKPEPEPEPIPEEEPTEG